MTSDLRYPIGQEVVPAATTPDERAERIEAITSLPAEIRAAVTGLSEAQLDTPYRPDGWTVRQLVHHVADSHANGYIRLKLALTEPNPTIKPYAEALWAELADSALPIELSLRIIDGIHARWSVILHSLAPDDFKKTYQHPERGSLTIDQGVASYVWHGKHHTAHITELRKSGGW